MTKAQRIAGICKDLRSGRFARKQAKPRWCRHIKWIVTAYGWKEYLFQDSRGYESWAESDWRYCPICAKPRPR